MKIEKLKLIYHTKTSETLAVSDLSFSVDKGEFVSIIGPSGCGKTTVLSAIAGLVKKSGGKISLYGEEIDSTRKNIGYMLQKDHLFE